MHFALSLKCILFPNSACFILCSFYPLVFFHCSSSKYIAMKLVFGTPLQCYSWTISVVTLTAKGNSFKLCPPTTRCRPCTTNQMTAKCNPPIPTIFIQYCKQLFCLLDGTGHPLAQGFRRGGIEGR